MQFFDFYDMFASFGTDEFHIPVAEQFRRQGRNRW